MNFAQYNTEVDGNFQMIGLLPPLAVGNDTIY